MNKSRVVVLGIDGMDFNYVSDILSELPTIQALSEKGKVTPFRSVFPPDSIPSWITCYTGKNPSEHGVLESVNYFSKSNGRLKVDTSAFQGETFWDYIGNAGYKVCVINPFMAYPVWPVNGLMVNGPVFIDGNIQVSDESWLKGATIPQSLGGIVDFPTKNNIAKFVSKTFSDTVEQAEFGLALFKEKMPEFYFQTFLTLDRMQHFLWRYCDPLDPTYPGSNPYEDSIKNLYIFMDGIISDFLNAMAPDDKLIVISDHGHGMRCTHCFNVNEFLRRNNYVRSVAEGEIINKYLILEKTKNGLLNFMYKFELEDLICKLAKFVPNAEKLKKGKHITKNSNNKAYASDFAGTNPFGGVCINRKLINDYSKTRNNIMELLKGTSVDGEVLFEWVKEREKMFSGKFLERFPDILFCLKPRYGVNWNLHTKEITINPTHKKISGGHKEYGVFFSNIAHDYFDTGEHVKMENFFSTVLSLFNIPTQDISNSKSFINIF